MATINRAELHRIGDGPVATVYSGHRAGIPVALKVFPRRLDKRTLAAFNKEQAKLSAMRSVTSILPVDGVDELDTGELAVRMELCPQSLAAVVDRVGPLPPADVAMLGRSVAEALAAAHGAGVVHGGMSPHNILYRTTGEPALADFGVTLRHAFARDPLYAIEFLPPETLRTGILNESTDLYGLGAVLHYALSGRSPHPGRLGEQPGERVLRILGEPVPAINAPDVPLALSTLVARLLATDPTRRLNDPSKVAQQLATLLPNAPHRPPPDDFDDFDAPQQPVPPPPPARQPLPAYPPPQPFPTPPDDFDDFATPYGGRPVSPAPTYLPPPPPPTHGPLLRPPFTQPPAAQASVVSPPAPHAPVTQAPITPPPTPQGLPPQAPIAQAPVPPAQAPVVSPLAPPAPIAQAPAAPAPATQVPPVQAPIAQVLAGQTPPGQTPPGQTPPAQTPSRQALAAQALVVPPPAPLPRNAQPPVAEARTTQTPSAQAPTTQTSAAEAPATEASARQVPPAQASAVSPLATSAPIAQAPAAQVPPAQAPIAQAPDRQPPPAQASGVSPLTPRPPNAQAPVVEACAIQTPPAQAATTQASAAEASVTESPQAPAGHGLVVSPPAPLPRNAQAPVVEARATQTPPAQAPATQTSAAEVPVTEGPAPQVQALALPPSAPPAPAPVVEATQGSVVSPPTPPAPVAEPPKPSPNDESGTSEPPVEASDLAAQTSTSTPPAPIGTLPGATPVPSGTPIPRGPQPEWSDFPPAQDPANAWTDEPQPTWSDFSSSTPSFASPTEPERRKPRYDLLVGAGLLLAVIAFVLLLVLRDEPEELTSNSRVPDAAPPPPDVEVELLRPTDLIDRVELNWRSTESELDFAVVVAAEGQKTRVLLAKRNQSMTVPVQPGRKYCFQVQATNGNDTYESDPVPLRGATCRK